MNIFPNPAREHIIVHIDNVLLDKVLKAGDTKYLGQIVYTAPVFRQESVIDISSGYGYGIYFIRLRSRKAKSLKAGSYFCFKKSRRHVV
jgi:hypothetical protein